MATICMNEACKSITTIEWKKGWGLKSGGLATLCYNCGSVYESLVYCETFHLDESGWRECRLCGKRIHCGCVASKTMHEYLDSGGVGCIGCVKTLEAHSFLPVQIPNEGIANGFSSMSIINKGDLQTSFVDNRMNNGGTSFDMGNFIQLSRKPDPRETDHYLQPHKTIMKEPPPGHNNIKHEEIMIHVGEVSTSFAQRAVTSSLFPKPDGNNIPILTVNDLREPSSQPSLHFSLGPLDSSNTSFPVPSGGGVEGREQPPNKVVLPFQQAQKSRQILPKLSKTAVTISPDPNKGSVSQARVPRPPAEGRGRNQLLPRYWPRITDQELQKISGDLNSTILPLFEKVLSASDAGRIGRLVLPKACAEAYFPSISQSEGIPIKIQDVTGKEWTFQFRFWPNNNSRMYVLEGVTPCIQNMQLQAGDTVTFSRLDPGGKLVIGFRKSTNSVDTVQEGHTTPVTNGGAPPGETVISSCANDSSSTPTLGGKLNEESSQQQGLNQEKKGLIQEKKKSRNIGLKSKRLLMHTTEAMELKLTWEEAQELLRPSPSSTPSIVIIDEQEFEEYEEPPVFGRKTVFTARLSGKQEQWTQCDSCWKWRRLPVDALLPPKWTCSDNVWDQSRCLCSAADEINPKEMESLLKADFKKRKITETKPFICEVDFKKRKISETNKVQIRQDQELSGLEALATAAVLGDNLVDLVTEPSSGPTTKHPRHREGCTCIVCIQPPSGKGKHKPTCMCNVCMTVKRRFKTLMLRKKKQRESEREAETGQGKDLLPLETEGTSGQGDESVGTPPVDEMVMVVEETDEGKRLDLNLNSHPNRDEEMLLPAGQQHPSILDHPRSEEETTTAAIPMDQV